MQRLERFEADAELARPSNETRFHTRQAALPAAACLDSLERPAAHRFALSFQLELARLPPGEEWFDRSVRRVVDEHRTRLTRRLQTGSEVDRVAERGVLHAIACADLTDDDRPGRCADTHSEAVDAPAAKDFAPVVLELGDDAQGGPERALGVVFARGRRPEEGEHAVAREILDVAAERFDLADNARHRLADDELHVLGVEPLAERGRADDVGEQRRQYLALFPDGGRVVHAPSLPA